ncbi:hypothetical protein SAMN05421874_14623 [Nonomuraea maritima]|uniref:Uncharacterized protein n=1 Tax=Nonomuraea maritima TaxID=683260 RepID=A0A1G9RIU2_9ACTN|nr:hypothetical protein SAMN05421874_14623 [Nonomuraea maritima]
MVVLGMRNDFSYNNNTELGKLGISRRPNDLCEAYRVRNTGDP